MSSVKLKLPLGGSKTISAPDSASDETITLPAGNQTVATQSQVNGLGGRKNLIINGGFDVWQRGTSFTATSVYSADRWKAQFGGNQGTVAQETTSLPSGSRYGLKMTATATDASGWSQMGQQIEYKNFYQAVGQTVTISFYGKAHNTNSGSTNITVRTRTNTTEDTSTIFSGAGTTTAVTLTTSWVKYTVTRTIPSDSKAWSIEFVMGAFTNGDGYTISQVQLELGSVATDFEHRSYGEELALCQRYYQRYGGSPYVGIASGSVFNVTTKSTFFMSFTTTMRASPSATFADLISTDRATFDAVITTLSGSTTGTTGAYFYCGHAAAGSAWHPSGLAVKSTTSGYLALDAEL